MNNKILTKNTKKYYIHYLKPQIELNGFTFYDFNKINKIKEKSLDEIFIYDLLEYIKYGDLSEVVEVISNKLTKNGILHIQGTDMKSLCLAVVDSQLDSNIFRSIVLSPNKKNLMSFNEIRTFIDGFNNIHINKIKFINGLQYYIECSKNE